MNTTRLSWTAGILLFILAGAQAAGAAPRGDFGVLQGRILDAATGDSLTYANVNFFRMSKDNPQGEPAGGAMGTGVGTYLGRVKPGLYRIVFSYISYEQDSVEGILVAAGDTVTVDGSLNPSALEVDKVVVVGEVVRTAEGSMITKLRNEAALSEAITSSQISKSGDGDAAEALERVTGVSVVQGRYVYVRGLGERYSSTQVNGAAVGTPEPNRKVVPLDIFPAGVLDNVVIQKTYSPDMDGEFAGSVINLNTKEFSKNLFRQSLSLGRAQNTSGSDYLSYSGGGLDFLGFDDGTRSLPDAIQNLAGNRHVDSKNFSRDQLAAMGRSFANVWTPRPGSSGPDFGYSGLFSKQFRLFRRKTGLLASASLSNKRSNLAKEDNVYSGGRSLAPLYQYDVRESEATVLGGATGNLSMELADDQTVKLNLLYTRHSEDKSRVAQGPNDNRGRFVRITQLSYVERGLFSGVLQGSHASGFLDSHLDWNLSLSAAGRNEPDRRTAVYEQVGNQLQATGAGSAYPMTRIFGEAHDHSRAAKVDWTIPVPALGEEGRVKTGLSVKSNDRNSAFRRFGFTERLKPKGTTIDRTQTPEELLSPQNLQDGIYTVEETTRPNDSYSADKSVRAGYLLADARPLSPVRIMAGARYERSVQNVDARSPFVNSDPGSRLRQADVDWLPSANLILTVSKKSNLRLAYSRTLNRPELRELSPFNMFNWENGYSETGDTTLVTAHIDNLDTRLEFYPGPGEYAAVGAFTKDFDRPIQRFVNADVGGYALKPQNGVSGRLSGVETEVRLSFVTLWKVLDWMADLGPVPESMLRWSLAANHTWVHSRVKLTNPTGQPVEKPFSGQSKYSTNVGLFYGHHRWEGGLLYKSFGKRLMAFGISSRLPDIYEYPPQRLDFTLSYRFSGTTRLKLTAENLLDQALTERQGDRITQRYKSGVGIGISIHYAASGDTP